MKLPPMRVVDTERLALEPQTVSHAEQMFPLLSDPAIYEFENAPPATLEDLRDRYHRLESRRSPDGTQGWLNWVVRERASREAIGYVQVTVSREGNALIAYEFASRWWGRGLAREATGAAIRELADAYGVATVGAVFKRANHRSRRLLQRLGMRAARDDEFPGALKEADEAAMTMRAWELVPFVPRPPTFG